MIKKYDEYSYINELYVGLKGKFIKEMVDSFVEHDKLTYDFTQDSKNISTIYLSDRRLLHKMIQKYTN